MRDVFFGMITRCSQAWKLDAVQQCVFLFSFAF